MHPRTSRPGLCPGASWPLGKAKQPAHVCEHFARCARCRISWQPPGIWCRPWAGEEGGRQKVGRGSRVGPPSPTLPVAPPRFPGLVGTADQLISRPDRVNHEKSRYASKWREMIKNDTFFLV